MDDKVAIVTGGAGGIGRAEALLLASEGARVVVNDLGVELDGSGGDPQRAREVAREITEAGGRALASDADVSTAAGAEAAIRAAVEAWGRVDVLVNGAGILQDRTLLKMDEASWRSVLRVHLDGTFWCLQAAARQMIEQGDGGWIVNTTSQSGLLGNFGQSNYAAAEAGVYGLTRSAAIELQRHHILVNAIAPVAKTRMTEALPMFQGTDSLTADHVAPAALYFASALCGDRTGNVLAVSGAQMFTFKLVQTHGQFKDGGAAWTAAEIAEHWDAIAKA